MKIIEDGTVTNPKGYQGAGLHIGIKKKNKDFATADAIRDELSAMGITIKDTRQGVQWFRN